MIAQYFEELFNTGADLPIRTDLRGKTTAKSPREYLEWSLMDQNRVDPILAAMTARMLNFKISVLKVENLEVVDLNHAGGMSSADIVLVQSKAGFYAATRKTFAFIFLQKKQSIENTFFIQLHFGKHISFIETEKRGFKVNRKGQATKQETVLKNDIRPDILLPPRDLVAHTVKPTPTPEDFFVQRDVKRYGEHLLQEHKIEPLKITRWLSVSK